MRESTREIFEAESLTEMSAREIIELLLGKDSLTKEEYEQLFVPNIGMLVDSDGLEAFFPDNPELVLSANPEENVHKLEADEDNPEEYPEEYIVLVANPDSRTIVEDGSYVVLSQETETYESAEDLLQRGDLFTEEGKREAETLTEVELTHASIEQQSLQDEPEEYFSRVNDIANQFPQTIFLAPGHTDPTFILIGSQEVAGNIMFVTDSKGTAEGYTVVDTSSYGVDFAVSVDKLGFSSEAEAINWLARIAEQMQQDGLTADQVVNFITGYATRRGDEVTVRDTNADIYVVGPELARFTAAIPGQTNPDSRGSVSSNARLTR